MALGRTQNNSNLNVSILKIKVKDENLKPVDPYFQLVKKVDGAWVVQPSKENFLSGKLTKLATKTTQYNGEDIHQIEANIVDGEDLYVLDMKLTMLNRSIVNSLLNLTDFSTPIEISLYTNKSKYPAAAVRQNNEMVRWKFSLDDQPKAISVMFKGKEQRDFTPIDNFFLSEVRNFGLGKSDKVNAPSIDFDSDPAQVEAVEPDSTDDIPF